jgi:hypothetical protein
MTTKTRTLRRLAIIGAAFVAAALGAPLAAADPPTVPLPISASPTPRLGEQLSAQDRSWLASSSQESALRLGEQLSGQDRSWLASEPSQRPAPAGRGFAWGDAGIGAATTLAAVLIALGGVLLIRGRVRAGALRPSGQALGR